MCEGPLLSLEPTFECPSAGASERLKMADLEVRPAPVSHQIGLGSNFSCRPGAVLRLRDLNDRSLCAPDVGSLSGRPSQFTCPKFMTAGPVIARDLNLASSMRRRLWRHVPSRVCKCYLAPILLVEVRRRFQMKTMTCKELGGQCDQELSAESWDEMVKVMTKHVMEKHPDVAKEMEKMHKQDPQKWGKEMKPKWNAAPDL